MELSFILKKHIFNFKNKLFLNDNKFYKIKKRIIILDKKGF